MRYRTIDRVLFDNLHNSNHSRNLAVGVVEECIISLLHLLHDVPC